MHLSAEEADFMKAGGNILQAVAEPVDYDRDDVIYPVSMHVYPDKKTFRWVAEKGREYEPLPAGIGRYLLAGACKYLGVDDNGWEFCTVYDRRPQVCSDFEEGSEKCLLRRQVQGVPLPDPTKRQ